MKTSYALLLLTLCRAALALEPPPPSVSIELLPQAPLIETSRNQQLLNFDFLLKNGTKEPLEITSIEVSVLGAGDVLIAQRRVGTNGDSILTVPDRALAPDKKLVVFNPIHAFPLDLTLETLRYEFVFGAPGQDGEKARATCTVKPVAYPGKTALMLPTTGRVLVHDGHDFYSHHRRLDITGGMTTALGITSNFGRYAYDLCVVDEKGRMFKGTGERNEDWYGFGTKLVAPGDGVVVAMARDRADNTRAKKVPLDRDEVMKDVRVLFGNYVVIDHENGEFSFLAHMKQGSVLPKVGQRVKRGEKVGEMGFSGDAFLVHVHYQVQSDSKFGEGLPSYFRDFRRVVGAKSVFVTRGQVDSGDVLESPPAKN
ncbi:MAG: M23 family metallopeptidase [Thermoanaerobaculia bacterium]